MPGSDYEIDVLNRLIRAAADSVDESRACADIAPDDRSRAMHCERAEMREDIILELQTRVRELGGEPSGHGDPVPAIPMNAPDPPPDPVCHQDAEAHMIGLFKAAIEDQAISGETRTVVQASFASLKRDRTVTGPTPGNG